MNESKVKKKVHSKEERKEFIKTEKEHIKKLGRELEKHIKRNININHINYKIHHLLRDPFIFISAYAKISKNRGALTKGYKDSNVMVYFGQNQAKKIAKKIKEGTYKFSLVRRAWITKPGKKKKRLIDVPTQSDRVVQEALRGILEAIYEPIFKEQGETTKHLCNNYGFRPKQSTWSAISKLEKYSRKCNIIIEGDIVSAYNNVDHGILMEILKKRIKDHKFLKLIKDMLKSGIMDRNTFEHSLNGTPQGGIVSPFLFNIYMLGFDQYIYEDFIVPILNENKGKSEKEKSSTKYNKAKHKADLALKAYKKARNNQNTETKPNIKQLRKKFKEARKIRNEIPYADILSLTKGAVYVRYADNWVLAITCTISKAEKIKKKIAGFLKTERKMELDVKKTKITYASKGYKFLGFEIRLNVQKPKLMKVLQLHKSSGHYSRPLKRTTSRQITIEPDSDRILKRLRILKVCRNNFDPIGKLSWRVYDEFAIVQKYAQIFRGIFNYYAPCGRLTRLAHISYILQYSCARTLAGRKKISMSKVFQKYTKKLIVKKTILGTKEGKTYMTQFPDFTALRKALKTKPTSTFILEYKDPFRK